MSKQEIDPNTVNVDVLITDLMLRITALENVLIRKNLISLEELQQEMQVLTDKVLKAIKPDANQN